MAQPPPPHTNLNPNDDKGPRILGVLWALTGFTTLIVVARVYIRLAVVRSFGLDDYMIVLGIIVGFVYCAVSTAAVAYGFGKHSFLLDQEHLEKVLLLDNISFLWGILFFTIPKLAIAALLNRILNRSMAHQILLWGVTGFAGLVSCICIVVLFTMCDPPEAMWKPWLVEQGVGSCRDQDILVNYAIFTGAVSAFTDLFLAFYPSTILMKLKMSLRKRVALCGALGLGCIASAMAIVKCIQLPGLNDKTDLQHFRSDPLDLCRGKCRRYCILYPDLAASPRIPYGQTLPDVLKSQHRRQKDQQWIQQWVVRGWQAITTAKGQHRLHYCRK